jgi:multicomponent Na+:H+ antiporter subunit E
VLIREIVKANGAVIHLILTQKEEVQPQLVTFQSDLETTTGRAFLANAITLTPGTITVALEENSYTVHCLDEGMAEGLCHSEFEERIRELEK